MGRNFYYFIILGLFAFFISCTEDEGSGDYNAEINIDSLKQDSFQFGPNIIPGNLTVYYSVINNDFDDIHTYLFTINALNADSVSYSLDEQSSIGVPGESVKTGIAVMGIGKEGYLDVKLENIEFE